MSQFHVDQIANYLRDNLAAMYWRADLDEINNLSRLLAVHSAHLSLESDLTTPDTILEVTDGAQDRGIDAIAVDLSRSLLVLVQSKWKQDGVGNIDAKDVIRFTEGVRSLMGSRTTGDPFHATQKLRDGIKSVLMTPSAKVLIATASTGNRPLSQEAMEPIQTLLAEVNDLEDVEPVLSHHHFMQSDLFRSLTAPKRGNVDLDLSLLDWGGRTSDPLLLYYGKISGADIARWYSEHRSNLFAENIRVVIPRSDINSGMAETVRRSPERFGYYNNGIVILAEKILPAPGGILNRDVLRLRLDRASIVNGAQTVSTLGSILGTQWEENLSQVFVLTRCIQVPAEDPSLARGITRYANTQNEVSSQDFAFLDEQQHRISQELSVLGIEYIIRQAESPTGDDPAKIIYLRDAATALACADGDLGLSVTAKREVSRLFAQNGTEYKRLFNPSTDPVLLYRSVQVVKKIDEQLDEISSSSSGVEYGVAVHGRLTIAHLALARAGRKNLADPSFDFDSYSEGLPDFVSRAVAALTSSFPENSYPGNVFKNRPRTEQLIRESGLVPTP